MNHFKRVLIKLSGESFASDTEKFNFEKLDNICHNIQNIIELGTNISLVIGGGNIMRGRDIQNSNLIQRETADSVGMLSTVMNSIILRDALLRNGVHSTIVSPLDLPFEIKKLNQFIVNDLSNTSELIIFAGGLGVPYFSTDTVTVVGAALSNCTAIFKATKADGIYDKDPNKFPDAKFLPKLTYDYALQNNLQIMDDTAFLLARQHKIPIYVFSANAQDCFVQLIRGNLKHSVVTI